MQEGDMVKVYQDPMTCEQFEGEARLIALVRDDEYLPEWKVTFPEDDGMIVLRTINVNHC